MARLKMVLNIVENFNRLSRVHNRNRETTDRQTDDRQTGGQWQIPERNVVTFR